MESQPRESAGRIDGVLGSNFSGRSNALKHLVRGQRGAGARRAYVGPEVYNCLSGLAATVDDELRLHCDDRKTLVAEMGEQLGISWAGARNPFTLSGGEQVLLALACGLLIQPEMLAVDCALEQLDHEVRERVLMTLERVAKAAGLRILVADNRMAEHVRPHARIDVGTLTAESAPQRLRLKELDAGVVLPSRPPPSRIEIEDLCFTYGPGMFSLRNLSFALEPGWIYVLEGGNGAGKSTLAKLLSGVLRPSRGRILVNGQEQNLHRSPGRIVAYHFQNPDVQLFETTVEKELSAGAGNHGDHSAVTFACDAFGLGGVLGEHPLDLPFTMRKRLALAATVAMGRPWLIIDEPTLAQDDAAARALAAIVDGLRNAGFGIVVISHSHWFKSLLPSTKTIPLEGGTLKDGQVGREEEVKR